jgi:hypothetical protein
MADILSEETREALEVIASAENREQARLLLVLHGFAPHMSLGFVKHDDVVIWLWEDEVTFMRAAPMSPFRSSHTVKFRDLKAYLVNA